MQKEESFPSCVSGAGSGSATLGHLQAWPFPAQPSYMPARHPEVQMEDVSCPPSLCCVPASRPAVAQALQKDDSFPSVASCAVPPTFTAPVPAVPPVNLAGKLESATEDVSCPPSQYFSATGRFAGAQAVAQALQEDESFPSVAFCAVPSPFTTLVPAVPPVNLVGKLVSAAEDVSCPPSQSLSATIKFAVPQAVSQALQEDESFPSVAFCAVPSPFTTPVPAVSPVNLVGKLVSAAEDVSCPPSQCLSAAGRFAGAQAVAQALQEDESFPSVAFCTVPSPFITPEPDVPPVSLVGKLVSEAGEVLYPPTRCISATGRFAGARALQEDVSFPSVASCAIDVAVSERHVARRAFSSRTAGQPAGLLKRQFEGGSRPPSQCGPPACTLSGAVDLQQDAPSPSIAAAMAECPSSEDESYPRLPQPCSFTSSLPTPCQLAGSSRVGEEESFPPEDFQVGAAEAVSCPPPQGCLLACRPMSACPPHALTSVSEAVAAPAVSVHTSGTVADPAADHLVDHHDVRQDSDGDSCGSSSFGRARLSHALATLQPEVPFDFVSFDIFRGPVVYHMPHGQGPTEAILHALQHAPFPNPTWTHTRAHIPGFPQFQILLMRERAPCTVVLDLRPLEGEVFAVEVGPEPFTGQQLVAHAPFGGRVGVLAQVLRASQLILFHNHRPWALAYALQLTSGDFISLASRVGSFLQVHAGLRWSPQTASTSRGPPLIVARVGAPGLGTGFGAAPGQQLLLALARALRNLLQEAPHLNHHFLVASPLQDVASPTYREVRFMATTQLESDAPTVWLDRRLIGGGLHHLQVPSCLHAADFNLFESQVIVDLAALRDVAAIYTGSTLQQLPAGHQGGGLVPVTDLFHLEGMPALAAWRYSPPFGLVDTFGPDLSVAASLRAWLEELSAALHQEAEGSRVRVLSPGSSLTTVVGLVPPSVHHLAAQVGEWLYTHHGSGTLFDCQLAAGDVCLFAFLPDHVGSHFAGAVQFVRGHPFFRLVSRGALHFTPAERLRFLTFETDAAHTQAVPLVVSADSSSGSPGEEHGGAEQDGAEEPSEGFSLLQRSARCTQKPGTQSPVYHGGGGPVVGGQQPPLVGLHDTPSPLRYGQASGKLGAGLLSSGFIGSPGPISGGGIRAPPTSTPANLEQREKSGPPSTCVGLPADCSLVARVSGGQGLDSASPPYWSNQAAALNTCGEVRFPVDLSAVLRPGDAAASQDLARCAKAAEVIARLTRGLSPCVLLPDISGLSIPDWLRAALSDVPVCGLDRLQEVGAETQIYTDGSEREGKAGYGLAVTVYTPGHGLAFLGAFALNSAARNLGEELLDAQEAESAGIALALLWILASPPHVRHCVRYDCKSAGLGAEGVWRPARNGDRTRKLSLIARHLTLLVRACGRLVCFAHVKAHEGQVWNELVDACAAAAGSDGSVEPLLPADVRWLVASEILPWAWIMPGRRAGDLPTVWALAAGCAGDFVSNNIPSGNILVPMHRPAVEVQHAKVQWTGASYNVCSLGTRHEREDFGIGLWGPLRQQLLQSQLVVAGVSWIGLQETRLPSSSCFESQGWLCINTACTPQGQGGCSLWLNQSQKWTSRLSVVRSSHVHVVVSEPQILIVRVATPGVSAVFVVAHAPHSKRVSADREDFWDRLSKLTRRAVQLRDELFVCIDANGRVWSPDDSGMLLRGEKASPNGHALAAVATEFDLCAPAVGARHQGPNHTWVSPTGFKQRIDFVLIPGSFSTGVTRSCTFLDLEWAGVDHDHFPVLVSFSFARSRGLASSGVASRRLPVPVVPPGTSVELTPAPWSLGVDAHLDFLTKGVQELCHKYGQKPAPRPRRSYISEGILQLVRLKRHFRRLVRAWQCWGNAHVLRCCFAAWRVNGPVPAVVAEGCRATADVQVAVHWRALVSTDRELRSALRAAKVAKLDAHAKEFSVIASGKNFASLFKALRPFRVGAQSKSGFRPAACLPDLDGQPCADPASVALVWSRHFGRIEGGDVVSPEQLCHQYRTALAGAGDRSAALVRLRDLPTCVEWESQFHGLKAGKAPGADGISHDVIAGLHGCVQQGSYALALKAAVIGSEPLRWRGGLVTALYKGKGSLSDVGAFRSILVSEVLAKRYHGWVRKKLEPWLSSVSLCLQQGPTGHHSTPEMSLAVRAVQMHMQERKLPLGCLFVDITSAFYSVLREFLLPSHASVESLVALCAKLGLSTDATADVLATLASQEEPNLSRVWQSRVADVLRHTWFQVIGAPDCVATQRGSRPGDPLADLLFGIVMAQALADIQRGFEAEGLSPVITHAGILPGVHVGESVLPAAGAWQDDAVFFITAASSEALIESSRTAVRCVHSAFTARGLELNYKPSKTELLLCPVGSGTKVVKGYIYQQPPFQVAVLPETGSCLSVRVVSEYQHLGSVIEWSGSLAPAIAQAIEGAANLVKPLRKHVFGNRDAPIAVRVMLFRSLVLSKALYASGAWSGLTKGESMQWQAGITRLLKFLIPSRDIREDPKISLLWLLRTVRVPAPSVMIRLERMRLLGQILSKDTGPLRKILEAAAGSKRCWLTDVLADLRWLQALAAQAGWDFPLLADFHLDLECTFCTLRDNVGRFGGILRRAWAYSAKHCSPRDIVHSDDQPSVPQQCPLCGNGFKGLRGLSSHCALKHGVYPAAAWYVPETSCAACQRDFHCKRRAVRHVQRSPQCFQWLRSFTKAVAPGKSAEKTKQTRVSLRAAWRRPCVHSSVLVEVLSGDESGPEVTLEKLLHPD